MIQSNYWKLGLSVILNIVVLSPYSYGASDEAGAKPLREANPRTTNISDGPSKVSGKGGDGGTERPMEESFSIMSDTPLLFTSQSPGSGIPASPDILPVVDSTQPAGEDPHSFSISTTPPVEGEQNVDFAPAESIGSGALEFSSLNHAAVVSLQLQLNSNQVVTFQCSGLSTDLCSSMNFGAPAKNFSRELSISSSDLAGSGPSSMSIAAIYGGSEVLSNSLPMWHLRVEQFSDIFPNQNDLLHNVLKAGDKLYFVAGSPDGFRNSKLFVTDGGQIRQLTDLSNAPESPLHDDRISSLSLCPLQGSSGQGEESQIPICFTGFSWPHSFLYRYSGGEQLERIGNLSNFAQVSSIGEVYFNGESFFASGRDVNMHYALFRIDPVDGGATFKAHRLTSNPRNMWNIVESRTAEHGSAIYFITWPNSAPGIQAAYTYVHVLYNGHVKRLFDTSMGINPAPQELFGFRNGAVFSARDPQGDYRIYFNNHVTGQLTALAKTNPNGMQEARLKYVDQERGVYFEANNPQGHRKLFMFNGNSIRQVLNLNPQGNEYFSKITPWGENGLLIAGEATLGEADLYYYDSASDYSLRLTNDVTWPELVTPVGNKVFFTAYDPQYRQKLYVYDRIQNYLAQVSDLNPQDSDYINQLFEFKGDIYFDGQNSDGLRKIYRLRT